MIGFGCCVNDWGPARTRRGEGYGGLGALLIDYRHALLEDRLEIQSLGALRNNLTVDTVGGPQATRNEVLTSIQIRAFEKFVRNSHALERN